MKIKNLIKFTALWFLIVGIILSAMTYAETSDFIHENILDGTGTITVCDPNSNWTKCITMMDKNLWASKSWTICSLEDSWACEIIISGVIIMVSKYDVSRIDVQMSNSRWSKSNILRVNYIMA